MHTIDEECAKILADRGRKYGDATESNKRLGEGWSALMGSYVQGHGSLPLKPWFVLLLQAFLKMNRIALDPSNRDSWLDCFNYIRLAHEAYTKERP